MRDDFFFLLLKMVILQEEGKNGKKKKKANLQLVVSSGSLSYYMWRVLSRVNNSQVPSRFGIGTLKMLEKRQ